MLYISYHNADIQIASQIVLNLKEHGIQVWFDRHEMPIYCNREKFLMDSMTGATFVLAFISNKYLSSSYCIQELELLQQYNTELIAIILDDIEVASINQSNIFLELIDIQNLSTNRALRQIQKQLFSHTGKVYKTTLPPERLLYIFSLINDMEVRLSETITATSLNKRVDNAKKGKNNHRTRFPSYVPSLTKEGAFSLTIDDEHLTLKNLLSLLEIQPLTILSGANGSGKSTMGRLIALHKAHAYRLSTDTYLPVYLDCQSWQSSQSFAEFFAQSWQLALDWRVWLSKNPIFFIIDIDELMINAHPDYFEQIESLCFSSGLHSCLLITPEQVKPTNMEMSVALVSTEPLNDTLIADFAETFLLDSHIQAFLNWYEMIEPDRLERQVDYVSFLIEYLNRQEEVDYIYPIRHLATRIIHQRWQDLTYTVDLPVSYAEFHSILTYLAWSMLCSKQSHYMLYSEALHHIGDSAIIELGIELDVFEISHDLLAFKSRLLQQQLAAYMLLDDGVYKHLEKAIFTDDGSIIEGQLDKVFLALFEIIEPEKYDELIELIDDVNPFLAIEFARRDKALLKQYLIQLIEKLLDVRRKNPLAHNALRQTLTELPYVEEIAIYLVRLMNSSDWQTTEVLFDYFQSLSPVIPDNIIQDVHNLERHFHDSQQALLSEHAIEYWVIYANQLIHHPDPTVQRNTISLLGESMYTGALPVLCTCLGSSSDSIYHDTVKASSGLIKDDDSFQYFLRKLPVERFAISNIPDISSIFDQLARSLSGYLVHSLSDNMSEMNQELCLNLIFVEEIIVTRIVIKQLQIDEYLTNEDEDHGLRSENVMRLVKLLQKRFQNINDKVILEQLYTDITRVLKNMGHLSSSDKNTDLYMRTQGSLSKSEIDTPPTSDDQSISSELLLALNHEDWQIRYQALQELMSYPDEEISPHLTRALIYDDDAQVRITALDMLSNINPTDEIQDVLIRALEDEDSLVIDQATDHFKNMESFDSSNIIHLLEHPSPQTIVATIEILTRHNHPDAVDVLGKLLDDERIPWLGEETVAYYAAMALKTVGTPLALQYIEKSQFDNRNKLVIELPNEHRNIKRNKYTVEQKIKLTLIAIRDDKWDLSQKAARYLRTLAKGLRGTQNHIIISELENALDDELWTLRWAVVEALAWIQSPTSIPKITERLQDSNWMVQVAAIRSLIELEAQESVYDIATLLEEPNTAVAETAAEALGIFKNPGVVNALEQALHSQDEFVRFAATKSILQILKDDATLYMFSMLDDPYSHIRWIAIKHMSTNANEDHLSAIARLLPDYSRPAWEKRSVSDYAIGALMYINTTDSQRIIRKWKARQK